MGTAPQGERRLVGTTPWISGPLDKLAPLENLTDRSYRYSLMGVTSEGQVRLQIRQRSKQV